VKTIKATWLETAGACESSVADFRRLFGEWCDVSVQNARLWIAHFPNDYQDDLKWLAVRLMDSFDHETMEELEDRLVIEREDDYSKSSPAFFQDRVDVASWALIQKLDDDRLTKAIEEIADCSTAL
jgi:hypothetical protein